MVISGVSNIGIGTIDAGTNALAVYGSCNFFNGSVGIGTTTSGTNGDLKLTTLTASGIVTINSNFNVNSSSVLTGALTQTGGTVSLSGNTTVNNNLNIITTNSNPLIVSNLSPTNYATINLKNSANSNAYIGVGGSTNSTTSNLSLIHI